MIRINFSEPDTPEWRSWLDECNVATAQLIDEAISTGSVQVSNLYKDVRLKEVYVSKDSPFYGKCAYCETSILGSQPGDIEHYRPKGDVTEEDGSPVRITVNGQARVHPGYYWLAYDWRNLLLACVDCNRPSRFKTRGKQIGKSKKFPVRGFRAASPGDETQEEPLLINPMMEDPEPHFEIDETGLLTALTDRGVACVEILGLNAREGLVSDRARAVADWRDKALATVIAICEQTERASRQRGDLEAAKRGEFPFSMACRIGISSVLENLAPLFSE